MTSSTRSDSAGAAPQGGPAGSSASVGGPFLEAKGVSLTYVGADGSLHAAVSNASFSVEENEFVSIIGPSGCGKTTLLKLVGDLLAPSSGEIRIEGRSPTELRERREIGYMFQSGVLLPWLTIAANVRMLADIARRPISAERLEELLTLVGIEGTDGKYPHELSGGMQQRAAIARALALDPTVLLMDEPFGALDEITRRRMNEELLEIWHRKRKTVVFVTHSIEEAAFLSDRVIVMATRPGRIVADVRIDFPRPRTAELRHSHEMTELVARLYGLLESGDGTKAAS